MNFISVAVAGLWPLVWHFGIAGLLVVGFLAAAYFSPVFKKDFIWAAAVVAVFAVAVALGVHLGEKRVHAQWDAARAAAFENGKQARADAVRDVARKPSRWLPNKPDRYNRDGH
jgi:hypothetical protein